MNPAASYPPEIVCSYLFAITRHGYPPPARTIAEQLGEMSRLGFVSVELEGIRREHLLHIHAFRGEIAAMVGDLGLRVPVFCAVLPGLASPDGSERRQNLDLLRKGCEIAQLLGSRTVLDNGPLPPFQFPGEIPVVRHYDEDVLVGAPIPANLDWMKHWDALIGTYRSACDIAADHGLTYTMHPSLGVLSATTDSFLLLAGAIGHRSLRFVIDTANQFLARDNLPLSVRRLAGFVDYIHLSDNRGARVEHLVPGTGNIRWDPFFNELTITGFDGLIGIDVGGAESGIGEIENAYHESARWLMARWPGPSRRAMGSGKGQNR